jgi:hypothetical protein
VKLLRQCRYLSTDTESGQSSPRRELARSPRSLQRVRPATRRPPAGAPPPWQQNLLCAAPAPTEVGRRPGPSKPREAADFKALLR